MTPIHLFNVVSQHNRWLSARQVTIAGNVANANTPGYKAVDVQPFEMAVDQARLAMTATQPAHMTPPDSAAAATGVRNEEPWEVTHTGNSVSLSTLARMVAGGAGLTLLPVLALATENRRGDLAVRRFAHPAPSRTLVLAWRKPSPLGAALRTLALAIREAYRGARAS